jgi:16S rRNA (guanine966-N2)-methyltransferase
VLLVEHGARAARVIRANIDAIGLPGAAVIADRVERVLARGPAPAPSQASPSQADPSPAATNGARYDVVFADPPYAMADADVSRILLLLADRPWLAPGALVIVERATRSGPLRWPDGFVPDRARKYGEATLWYGLGPGTPAQ